MKKIILLIITLSVVCILTAETSPGNTAWDNGLLKWKSEDGMFETRMDVRIYIDYAQFMGNDNVITRRHLIGRQRIDDAIAAIFDTDRALQWNTGFPFLVKHIDAGMIRRETILATISPRPPTHFQTPQSNIQSRTFNRQIRWQVG